MADKRIECIVNVDPEEQHRRNMVVMGFINGAISGNVPGFIASLEGIDWTGAWREIFEKVVHVGYVHPAARMAFRTAWRGNVEHSDSPYILAEQKLKGRWSLTDDFENDLDLMAAGLKLLMPPPVETSPVYCLYRGQDHADHGAGRHGVWWTTDPCFAEIFARAPTRAPSGRGVVLAAFVPGDAIVTALCKTEFLVDPRRLDGVVSVTELLPYQSGSFDVEFWKPRLVGVPNGYDAAGLDAWLAADRPVAGLASCRAAREPQLAEIRASFAA